MKKLLLVLCLLVGMSAFSQTTDRYTAVKTALYEKNYWESSWTYKDGNDDVQIPIIVTQNVITIDAKLSTSLKLYAGTGVPFNGRTTDGQRTFSGRTWKAYDMVSGINCNVDLLTYSDNDFIVLGVTYPGSPQINLRYYLLRN